MPYTTQEIKKLSSILEKIEGRKEHKYSAPTYKDTPLLKEVELIVSKHLGKENEKQTLVDSLCMLHYLAESYDAMGRFAVSEKIYAKFFETAVILKKEFGETVANVEDIFYSALKASNFYVDNDCEKLSQNASALIPEEKHQSIYSEVMSRRRNLKHDPVEMSEKYLAIIDTVEEMVAKNRKTSGHGSCHEAWSLKQDYLAKYGIVWKTPQQLNPRVHFD